MCGSVLVLNDLYVLAASADLMFFVHFLAFMRCVLFFYFFYFSSLCLLYCMYEYIIT